MATACFEGWIEGGQLNLRLHARICVDLYGLLLQNVRHIASRDISRYTFHILSCLLLPDTEDVRLHFFITHYIILTNSYNRLRIRV